MVNLDKVLVFLQDLVDSVINLLHSFPDNNLLLAIKIISVVVLMVDLGHVVHHGIHLVVVGLNHVIVEVVHHHPAAMKILAKVHLLLVLSIRILTFNLIQICRQYHRELVNLLFLLNDLFDSFYFAIFLLFSRHRYSSKSSNKQRYFDINIA